MSEWSISSIALLRKFHSEGYTFSDIARLLGQGFSRNACISKAARIGLVSTNHGRLHTRQKKNPVDVEPKSEIQKSVLIVGGIPLETAGFRSCRFPLWDENGAPDFLVCGNNTVPTTSWCEDHAARILTGTGRRV